MDIKIIIVSTNQKKYLVQLLKSPLFSTKKKQKNAIIIDNNSHDKTSHFLKKNFPEIQTMTNKETKGFAYNSNLGIKNSDNKYILLLNPDTEITLKAIEKLYVFLETHPRVGICGPKLVFPNGKLQMSCRRFPTWKTVIARRSPLRKFFINSKENKHHLGYDIDHSKAQPVDWLLGACLLIRKEALNDIGLLDEKYYLYVDDIDYCYRAWKKKWEVWYVPISIVIHHHLAESDKKLFSRRSWYHLKSMWHYYWKNIFFRQYPIQRR